MAPAIFFSISSNRGNRPKSFRDVASMASNRGLDEHGGSSGGGGGGGEVSRQESPGNHRRAA